MPASRPFLRRPRRLLPLLAGLAAPAFLGPAHAAPGATAGTIPSPPNTSEQKSLLMQMQDAFTNIAQTVEPTVVNIKAERMRGADGSDGEGNGGGTPPPPTRRRGSPPSGTPGLPFPLPGPRRSEATGSGVIVRADGYILTNDHVVEGASGGLVTVTLADGREYQGRVYADFKSDLAVVKIDPGATPLPVAGFADSSAVQPGQWAVAIGSPFDLQNTMTVGVISAVGRHQRIGGGESSARYYPDLIQTDAAINPGNSGGALVNMNGQLVGINSAIASLGGSSSVGGQSGSIGLGFAIPVDQANRIAQELITQGTATQAALGVSITATTPRAALTTHGATIAAVSPGGPADKAGITAGSVVTKVNDRLIPDGDSLVAAIRSHAPGDSLTLTLTGTHGAARTVHVTLGGITVQAGR